MLWETFYTLFYVVISTPTRDQSWLSKAVSSCKPRQRPDKIISCLHHFNELFSDTNFQQKKWHTKTSKIHKDLSLLWKVKQSPLVSNSTVMTVTKVVENVLHSWHRLVPCHACSYNTNAGKNTRVMLKILCLRIPVIKLYVTFTVPVLEKHNTTWSFVKLWCNTFHFSFQHCSQHRHSCQMSTQRVDLVVD